MLGFWTGVTTLLVSDVCSLSTLVLVVSVRWTVVGFVVSVLELVSIGLTVLVTSVFCGAVSVTFVGPAFLPPKGFPTLCVVSL